MRYALSAGCILCQPNIWSAGSGPVWERLGVAIRSEEALVCVAGTGGKQGWTGSARPPIDFSLCAGVKEGIPGSMRLSPGAYSGPDYPCVGAPAHRKVACPSACRHECVVAATARLRRRRRSSTGRTWPWRRRRRLSKPPPPWLLASRPPTPRPSLRLSFPPTPSPRILSKTPTTLISLRPRPLPRLATLRQESPWNSWQLLPQIFSPQHPLHAQQERTSPRETLVLAPAIFPAPLGRHPLRRSAGGAGQVRLVLGAMRTKRMWSKWLRLQWYPGVVSVFACCGHM